MSTTPLPPPDHHPSALAAVDTTRQLRRPLTSFIGREEQIAEVTSLLTQPGVRLVTLTGPGGVGKTRLALEVARGADAFPGGIWFVDLASVHDPALVGATIARALGIRQVAGKPVAHAIVATIGSRRVLLVLDNFEQIIPAGPLVTELLEACPALTVLVTSRVLLRVSGEHRFAVPAMTLPEADASAAPDDLIAAEAVRLFVERARARSPGFAITPANAGNIAAICRRLDGVPLAIELAAARTSAFSLATLLQRLDTSLPLLAGGPRDAPDRLRSMRDSIVWSYDLLTPAEQALFRQLGVFVGAWTLDAVEVVASEDEGEPVLDRLAALIDASLVRPREDASGSSTYTMLETIREFAAEQLDAWDEADTVRRRHADFITGLAQRTSVAFFLPNGPELIAEMHIHAPNVPTALAWLERQGDVDGTLRLTGALPHFWNWEGLLADGRAMVERALAVGRQEASPALGKALIALAVLVQMQGDGEHALSLCQEGLALLPDGDIYAHFGGYTLEGIITLRTYNPSLRALDLNAAVAIQRRALELVRSAPELDWTAQAESTILGHLGNIAVASGAIDDAERFFTQALDLQRALGYEPGTSHIMANHPVAGLGDVARARLEHDAALARYRDGLSLARRFGDYRATAYALGGVAGTLAAMGRWREAARLFGADEAYHMRGGFHFELETMDRQRALGLPEPWLRAGESFGAGQPLRDALWSSRPVPIPPIPNPETAATLWQEGRGLTIEEACRLALEGDTPVAAAPDNPAGLSAREREVLRLLAAGQTDQEIADALYISRRTAATHIQHIYTKIGVSSRASAAAWAVRQGLA